jgi:hypothetical protein
MKRSVPVEQAVIPPHGVVSICISGESSWGVDAKIEDFRKAIIGVGLDPHLRRMRADPTSMFNFTAMNPNPVPVPIRFVTTALQSMKCLEGFVVEVGV